jgi:hypothetical protein
MPFAQVQRLLKIEVVMSSSNPRPGRLMRPCDPRRLQPCAGAFALVLPAAQHIELREPDVAERRLVFVRMLVVALRGKAIRRACRADIHAKPGLRLLPAIAGALAAFQFAGTTIETLGVHPERVIAIVAEGGAVSGAHRRFLVAGAGAQQPA